MFSTRTRLLAAAIGSAAALTAAGCSADESETTRDATASTTTASTTTAAATTAAQRTDYNGSDVTFLEGMYPHHAQAVAMAQLVPDRSQNPQVIELAAAIERAQEPEMAQIAELLRSFGQPAPSAETATIDGHGDMQDGGDMRHGGMMSDQQMADLAAATGPDFDTMFLTMMVEHHQGAIDSADTELADGVNPDTKQLAETIRTTQQAEIEQMQGMLAGG